jgi:putative transposase
VAEYRASERHACELMEMARTTHRYCSRRDDTALREQLLQLAREKPRFGYRRIHVLLRREGVIVNHKKVQRVYRELGLSVKRTKRKRLSRLLRPRMVLSAPNEEWSLDFVSDIAASGQRLRVLAVVDSFTRECLALEVDTSLPSRRVTRALEQIISQRGLPLSIRCDNGPEITSRHFLAWCIERKIDLVHIQPGKPTQNAHVESFNGRLREECLNISWFWNLWDARHKIASWREDYNQRRPHSALNYRTPEEFRQQWSASPSSIMTTAEIGPASRQPCGLATLDLDPGPTPQ